MHDCARRCVSHTAGQFLYAYAYMVPSLDQLFVLTRLQESDDWKCTHILPTLYIVLALGNGRPIYFEHGVKAFVTSGIVFEYFVQWRIFIFPARCLSIFSSEHRYRVPFNIAQPMHFELRARSWRPCKSFSATR